ncbi:MAG TPA: hypothetical protein VK254_01470 [Candidatus Bathyarchaeia archaeon]|nr:hypothetical protein [Candidatus Bathyarchaeia archaeon]
MKINELPEKYNKLWRKCQPVLKQGRHGDIDHAKEVTVLVLNYQGKLAIDKDVLVPVAMMHDIGHAAILPEHFFMITGPKKLVNGKLVHMLAGAKIAGDLLQSVSYNKAKAAEIVDIISMHDSDQLKNVDIQEVYNTVNKKFFHDVDSLDRYTKKRLEKARKVWTNKKEIERILKKFLNLFFFDEFRQIAEKRIAEIF